MNTGDINNTEKYWLGVKLIPELDRKLAKLLEYFGSPTEIWKAPLKEILNVGKIPVQDVQKIEKARQTINLDQELRKLKEKGIEIITLKDPRYPELLRYIHYPPPVLFIKGNLITKYKEAIAIVGARKASPYGKTIAESLAKDLSQQGITIVSGVARGIDSAAHQGALEEKGLTIGVLGCGLDVVYPPENKKLYQEIAQKGSLITEYPLGTVPLALNFPARNRIISGLVKGVIIVEAGERSGALITADFALEQGREVFAVPGNIRSKVSKGTHKLLKQGACLIEKAEDVMEVFDLTLPDSARTETPSKVDSLPLEEKQLLEKIGWESRHIDEIIRDFKGDIAQVSSLLTILEIKGLVKHDAGQRYFRIQ